MSLTIDDFERFGPVVAIAAAVWRGSAVLTKLQSAIDALADAIGGVRGELASHAKWREQTDDRLEEIERVQAVSNAVDEVEKQSIKERLASRGASRAVRATEHQQIDRDALAARKTRKK